ncbi:MAG: L-histidine N(alpha)-methyltransferase, partial [Nocardioidaceae bacterium]
WIEMRLRAARAMRVAIPGVDLVVDLSDGEEIRTEVSAKFRREGVERELKAAGFDLDRWWTDSAGRFALSLARAV